MRRSYLVAGVLVALTLSACNRRVFQNQEPSCDATIPVDFTLPTQNAADILIVVDDSVSMGEEQRRLASNFFDDRCRLDLADLKDDEKNPSSDLYAPGGPLAECGFIQLIAAFDNDFQIGVITTTVPAVEDGVQHAGCLRTDDAGRSLIRRKDLDDGDTTNDDFAGRFSQTLTTIGVHGSSFERGLEAMDLFLDEDVARQDACADDLQDFHRPGANLVVIFLTDEEDCSHGGAIDESDPPDATRCYRETGKLVAVDEYARRLKARDRGAKVAAIAGFVKDDTDPSGIAAEGCLNGAEAETGCWPSHGNSVFTDVGNPDVAGDGQICSTDPPALTRDERGGLPCCVADAGSRYLEFAKKFGSPAKHFLVDSICKNSFRDTMLQIAAFIASTTFVDLVDEPKDDLAIVEMRRAGESAKSTVPEIAKDQCATGDGWYLEGRRIQFCGAYVPKPGDDVSIRAKAEAATPSCVEAASGD